MDEDVSRWILEFMIRKPIGDSLVRRLISILPLSNSHPRMKKTVLLRKIESEISDGSVSETILELLEIIEELDYKEGVAVLDSMKNAYCAVAVECTVKFLVGSGGKEGKYFDAVKRIWRGKIHKMESSATAGLVSDQLRKWRDDIEAAVWDARVCEDILAKNTRNDALRLVRAYVAEAWAIMGPPFLELAARAIKLVEGLPGAGNGSTCNQAAACSPNVATDLVVPDKDKGTSSRLWYIVFFFLLSLHVCNAIFWKDRKILLLYAKCTVLFISKLQTSRDRKFMAARCGHLSRFVLIWNSDSMELKIIILAVECSL